MTVNTILNNAPSNAPADLVACAVEVAGFLVPKAAMEYQPA